MLAAIDRKAGRVVPLSFMIFAALRNACRDTLEYAERQIALGVDATVEIPPIPIRETNDHLDAPGLPIRFDPRVAIREWKEPDPTGGEPLLHKVYDTPSGRLRTTVRQTGDWPYGDHVPFLDDYLVPRSVRFLLEPGDAMAALEHLLTPVTSDDLSRFRDYAARARRLADRHGLLLRAGRTYGLELAAFLCGMEKMLFYALDAPGFLEELVERVHAWSSERTGIMLEAGAQLVLRSGWYESSDLWSPGLFRRLVFPYLRREAEQVHAAGARFGHIMTSGQLPLVNQLIEAGVDVLVGVDPVQGKGMDLSALDRMARGRLALWGGLNGFVTVEMGTPADVRVETERALAAFGENGGFILSPVDNVRADTPQAWVNVRAMIDTWRAWSSGA
jgi:hypothetical protein